MTGLYGTSGGSLFSGWTADPMAASDGLAALSPQDRWASIFAGLSRAGERMAVPGLSKRDAFAAGMGGLGEGLASGNQKALIQRLLTGKLSQQLKQQTAAGRFATSLRTGGAGGADMLRSGGPTGGSFAPSPMLADMVEANPEMMKLAVEHVMPKPLVGKDRYQYIEGVGLVDYAAGPKPTIAMPPASRTDFGKMLEDQARQPKGSPQWNAFQALMEQSQIKDGWRTNADGSQTPTGSAALSYVHDKSYADAAGKAPFQTQAVAAGGSLVAPYAHLMPDYGLLSRAPRVGQPSTSPSAPSPMVPPSLQPPQPAAAASSLRGKAMPPQPAPTPAAPPASSLPAGGDPLAEASPEDLQRIANDPTYPADPAMRTAAQERLKAQAPTPVAATTPPASSSPAQPPKDPRIVYTDLRPASASPENSYDVNRSKYFADLAGELSQGGRTAARENNFLGTWETIAKEVEQDPVAPLSAKAKAWAVGIIGPEGLEKLGIRNDTSGATALQSITAQLGLSAPPKGQGAVSNYERDLYASVWPQLGQVEGGNKVIIEVRRAFNERAKQEAAFAREWEKTNKRLNVDFEAALDDKFGGAPILSPDLKARLEAIASGKDARPITNPKPAPASGIALNADDARAQAQAAIAKGADPAKVKERLKAAGFSTEGF